jgi:transposase
MSTAVVLRRRQAAEDRRMAAAELFAAGVNQADVARRLTVTAQAVNRWYHRWQTQGMQGLRARPPGRRPRLSAAEQAELVELVKAGPAPQQGGWTLRRINQIIGQRFGITYRQPAGVWKLLHRLGFTLQKPASRASERNEAAIGQFRTKGWAMIVKEPGPAGRGSSSPTRPASA